MMNKYILLLFLVGLMHFPALAQGNESPKVLQIPNSSVCLETLEHDWAALQESPPKLAVREGFLFLLDALDTQFLKPKQIEWLLKLLQTRIIIDEADPGYGNIYWGWQEKNNDVGDGNNVQFCVQYGILIKILFNDKLSLDAKKILDKIFEYTVNGVRNQKVRISYTNIYLMKIWNLVSFGQVYNQPAVVEEGRKLFNIWLNHVAHYGNREYDSPTYSGVDLESLLLLHKYCRDEDIRTKSADALNFFLTDLCSHYNERGGYLGGAHSRDYNRVFGHDLLEEKYMNPILGRKNTNNHLFHQICFSVLNEIGLSDQQKELMNRTNRFIVQLWDSIPNAFSCDYVGNKVSIASSNQTYSPDDKSFVAYLSSSRIPQMLNIAYNMEGRNDHYGTWAIEGKGEKMKYLMPANYPPNGGWAKTRHLMYFMQAAQNKGEFVMLAAGEKDNNCIFDYLNSTIILPNAFDEIWMGNEKISVPEVGCMEAFDQSNTFFARFENVVIAIRILWDNADKGVKMSLHNDGFIYQPTRESFIMANNKGLRLTLQHPNSGKGAIAMWWKVEEGITNATDFEKFRQVIFKAPVNVHEKNGIVNIAVTTPSGKLGIKADIINKKRLNYYNPKMLPKDFLFNVDGVEIGKPIMKKYIQ